MASVVIGEQVRIPLELTTLAEFRRWSHADEFPQHGRIDYVGGDIEVDMSPEELFAHGTLKGKIYATLLGIIETRDLGHLFTDSTRVYHAEAVLSVEPDIVFISHAALDRGAVQLVPKASGEPDRFVEIEGSPDLVVEIVSDSSVGKDNQRLLRAYFDAGIREYWIVDARHDPMSFQIFQRGGEGYSPVGLDESGLQASTVFGCRFRIDRHRSSHGYWQYTMPYV